MTPTTLADILKITATIHQIIALEVEATTHDPEPDMIEAALHLTQFREILGRLRPMFETCGMRGEHLDWCARRESIKP